MTALALVVLALTVLALRRSRPRRGAYRLISALAPLGRLRNAEEV